MRATWQPIPTSPVTAIRNAEWQAKFNPAQPWRIEDSLELYQVNAWGKGYFSVNAAGHLVVRPDTQPSREIDLFEVVEGLKARDLTTPVVVRFSDILAHRLQAPARRVRAGHRRERLPEPLRRRVSRSR